MALYTFDENNIVKSSAVDKNGYHRDGGNVFVDDVFPMNGDPDSYNGGQYWYVSAICELKKHEFSDAYGVSYGASYVYFGEKIDDSDFKLGLDGNTVIISNRVDLNLIVQKSRSVINLIKNYDDAYSITFDTTVENNSLPQNWKDLKAHIVIACRKKDADGNYIENNYGIIQIHQR